MVHRRHDILAIVIIVLCVVGYASFRTEFRLREKMPAEFYDSSRAPAGKRASEEKIARAYWKAAVTQVQWKYGYAHRLPDDPPDEFAVTSEEVGPAAQDSALRARYWQKLRDVWGISGVWQEEYKLNTIVLRQSFRSAGQWLESTMRRVTG
jgi:hypothetical protein